MGQLTESVVSRLNIAANRKARKYSNREMGLRVLWAFGQWLVRLSPRPCFCWRRFVLRCFGARIGLHVHIDPSARILFPWNLRVGDWSAIGEDVRIHNPGTVVIGQRVTISHGAHLCAGSHAYTLTDLPLLKCPIEISDQTWICSEAFVGPGVMIGEGAVIGARAVVTSTVAPWSVAAGNPAKFIGPRELHAVRG